METLWGHLVTERHHAGTRQRGDVHDGLRAALLLRVPERIRQGQPPLRVRVVHLSMNVHFSLEPDHHGAVSRAINDLCFMR
jgi:hypothetical protein